MVLGAKVGWGDRGHGTVSGELSWRVLFFTLSLLTIESPSRDPEKPQPGGRTGRTGWPLCPEWLGSLWTVASLSYFLRGLSLGSRRANGPSLLAHPFLFAAPAAQPSGSKWVCQPLRCLSLPSIRLPAIGTVRGRQAGLDSGCSADGQAEKASALRPLFTSSVWFLTCHPGTSHHSKQGISACISLDECDSLVASQRTIPREPRAKPAGLCMT